MFHLRKVPYRALGILIGGLVCTLLFTTLPILPAFAQHISPKKQGDIPCTQIVNPKTFAVGAQGVLGGFTLHNTCPRQVSGLLGMFAELNECIYGDAGASDSKDYSYTLPPNGQQIFRYSVSASCINCDCAVDDPARGTGFDLLIDLYNGEEIQDPFQLDLVLPITVYSGTASGGTLPITECGAGIKINEFRSINV